MTYAFEDAHGVERGWVRLDLVVEPGKGTLGDKPAESEAHRRRVRELTGIDKVPGSLNLRAHGRRVWFRRHRGVAWPSGWLYPGRVRGMPVVVVKRGGFGASPRLVHLYADRHLRQAFGLADGDHIELEVRQGDLVRLPVLQEAAYALRLIRRRLLS